MILDFAVLADGVTERPDGKLDVFGAGFDTIFALSVPVTHLRLTMAIRILLSRHETESAHRLEVVIQSADGPEVARASTQVDPLPEDARRQIPAGRQAGLPVILNFPPILFPEFGNYHVAVLWDGNEARPAVPLILAPVPESAQP